MRWTIALLSLIWTPLAISCTWQEAENLLALNMYHEARGEGTKGMEAVNNVVFSRLDDDSYPDTLCGIVLQPSRVVSEPDKCQFRWTCTEKLKAPVKPARVPLKQVGSWQDALRWEEAKRIAKLSMMGMYGLAVFGEPATLYLKCSGRKKTKWNWAKVKFVGKVGQHCFYAELR